MTRNNDAAAGRAAFIPDLEELAGRIDVVLANPWIDRGAFLQDTMHGLTQAAEALPAGPGRLQLADLAARIGRAAGDSLADREWCLRDTRDALGPLAESTAADLRAAADRAAWVAGLRDLADFLAGHPDVPVPPVYHTQSIHEFPDGDNDEERRAGVDRIAVALGVQAAESHGGHYTASASFGPVEYAAVAIPPGRPGGGLRGGRGRGRRGGGVMTASGTAQWLLPDDGIIDPVAVEITAAGIRRVRLTIPERRAAAALILARGGTANGIAARLHIGGRAALALAASIRADADADAYEVA